MVFQDPDDQLFMPRVREDVAFGPRNLGLVVGKRLTLRGFLVGDHADLRPEFTETVTGWLRSGDLVVRETVREGIEEAVPAFLDLLRGGNTGKMVVRLAPDPD